MVECDAMTGSASDPYISVGTAYIRDYYCSLVPRGEPYVSPSQRALVPVIIRQKRLQDHLPK